jgi:hypothetical protein
MVVCGKHFLSAIRTNRTHPAMIAKIIICFIPIAHGIPPAKMSKDGKKNDTIK